MAKRGSEALLEAWKNGPVGISEDFVRGVADLTADLDIHDILIKGQPRPDLFHAAVATEEPERCGTTVVGLVNLLRKHGYQGTPVIRLFPRGIPWPEQFVIDVTVGEIPGGGGY